MSLCALAGSKLTEGQTGCLCLLAATHAIPAELNPPPPGLSCAVQGVKFEAALKEACGKKLKQEDQLSADIEGCVLHLVAGVIDGVAGSASLLTPNPWFQC